VPPSSYSDRLREVGNKLLDKVDAIGGIVDPIQRSSRFVATFLAPIVTYFFGILMIPLGIYLQFAGSRGWVVILIGAAAVAAQFLINRGRARNSQ
jgi:hypothetical protein